MTTKTAADTAVVYPETDGMPLPDGEFQAPKYREIVNTLQTHFKDTTNTRVNGDTFIYYQEGDPSRRVAPDCYVVFGINLESIVRYNTYLLWEIGKPPDFVLEIASVSTAMTDLTVKRELYARLGIPEYWCFDSTGGDFYGEPLVGEYLLDGEYSPFMLNHEADGAVWAHSDALNLDLQWAAGRLRFYDPVEDRWLLSQEEEHVARMSAEERSDTEHAARMSAEERADAEHAARMSAEDRIAELEADLRRLRGE